MNKKLLKGFKNMDEQLITQLAEDLFVDEFGSNKFECTKQKQLMLRILQSFHFLSPKNIESLAKFIAFEKEKPEKPPKEPKPPKEKKVKKRKARKPRKGRKNFGLMRKTVLPPDFDFDKYITESIMNKPIVVQSKRRTSNSELSSSQKEQLEKLLNDGIYES